MKTLEVFGGCSLTGTVKVSGAKNSATKLLVASLLSDQKCVLRNIPDIGDVRFTVDLCREVGAKIEWDKKSQVIEIQTPKIVTTNISSCFSKVNRIPVLLIGALLSRTRQQVIVPIVGGDAIGERTVNFHLEGLKCLGAEAFLDKRGYCAHAKEGLVGAHIELPYPSVGATENLIFAAVRASGRTLIKNAALEAEIIDLIMFFQKMGVTITTDNDRTIEIFGSQSFNEVDHTVIPDKIEAASFGMSAVVTDGRIFVQGARHSDMLPFLNGLREIGGGFVVKDDGIEFFRERTLKGGVVVETDVHPGFLTDWQQPFAVLLTQAKGSSVIHETVHENRLKYLSGLRAMGADCELFYQCLSSKDCRYKAGNYPHSAVIRGVTPLQAAEVCIPDLRAGFAYVMAALIAEGEKSIIRGAELLDRGYNQLVANLESLGAKIRVSKNLTKKTQEYAFC
ncbi:UDP-N-acetylglucosamine 1-carboxyvinyltransferase [Chlamydiifrater volucris]|uniref:UDP-N-acetylglucosamine 1-carboxyvinyltransferase n=1 Tax=Chlamydiifrater volucris TaxID=2681470 RepID=UPI0032B110DC